MRELAAIYATIANMGEYKNLRTHISDPNVPGTQQLSPEAFFLTLDMLSHQSSPNKNVMFAANKKTPIKHYWKTGTSSSYRDAWTAGIFGDYVLIVWVGNFDGHPNNAFSGARAAAPIYFALADSVVDYFAARGTPVRDNNFLCDDMNIATVEMCDGVGGIAGPYCPKTVPGYFIPGKSPIDMSPVYRAVKIDKKSGLRACGNNSDNTITRVYEFWDAEYLDMFARAGVRRNTPPNFVPGCDLDTIATEKMPPVIVSPIPDTKTVILDNSDSAEIVFRALTENPDGKIFWFLDDEMIGTTNSGNAITHRVKMGAHTLRTIDESGTGTTTQFTVVK